MKHIYHSSIVSPEEVLPIFFRRLVETKSKSLKDDLEKEVRKHFKKIYSRKIGKNWEEISKKFPVTLRDSVRVMSSPRNWLPDPENALYSQFWAIIELPPEFPQVNFALEFPDKNKKIMEILGEINKIKYEVLEEFRKRKFLTPSDKYLKLPGIITVGDLKKKYPDIYSHIYSGEDKEEITIEDEVKSLRKIMYEV